MSRSDHESGSDVESRTTSSNERESVHEATTKEFKPLNGLKLMMEQPGKAYSLVCSSYCGVFIIWIVLIMALGSDFFPFETEVPLYLRDHAQKQRIDAVEAGKLEADLSLPPPEPSLQRSESIDDAGLDLSLEVVYVAKHGSIFTTKILAEIQAVEQRITSKSGYTDYCKLRWTNEQLETSANSALADRETQVNTWNTEMLASPVCSQPMSALQSCVPGSAADCSSVDAQPPGLLDCTNPTGCPASDATIDMSFVESKLEQYAAINPFQAAIGSAAQVWYFNIADSLFGGGNTKSNAIRSTFYFGLPLEGYTSSNDRTDEQLEKIEEFVWEYHDELFDFSGEDVNVYFLGYQMMPRYIQLVLPQDGALAIGSMVFVLCYLSYQLKSWFLAFMGMGQIIMAFAPAYILYYGIFGQRYFGTFNVLSIFIILGIGADDIFVLHDAWRQSLHQGSPIKDTLLNRMSYTWKRASKAMAVTSITTFVSFIANASSSFPAISTFGIFSAMLVLVNYCAVISFYPTVISYYTSRFEHKAYCCGLGAYCSCTGKVKFSKIGPMAATRKEHQSDSDENEEMEMTNHEDKHSELGSVERFFSKYYAPFIIKFRIPVIIFFLGLLALFASFGAQIEPDSDAVQFFPPGNNYQEFPNQKAANFARGGSINAIEVRFVFGFADPPLDRSGTRPTDGEDYGKPIWNENFDFFYINPDTGRSTYQCFVDVCEASEVVDGERATGGLPAYPSSCWVRDFLNSAGKDNVDNLLINGDFATFTQTLDEWVFGPSSSNPRLTNYDIYKEFIHVDADTAEDVTAGNDRRVRFTYSEIKLTADRNMDMEKGIAMHDLWETWMEEQLATSADCSDPIVAGTVAGAFQYSPVAWHNFFVQDKMVAEAMAGIGLSLGLAYLVLAGASGNPYLAAFSVAIIFCIVLTVFGFTVMMGWKLGLLESVNLVMVPGMAVDFVAHLAEGYLESHSPHRYDRVHDMLVEVGVSVISGALSTLGACSFLFLATITFFGKFGSFIFFTITMSLLMSLGFFPALMSTQLGPQGDFGAIRLWVVRKWKNRHAQS